MQIDKTDLLLDLSNREPKEYQQFGARRRADQTWELNDGGDEIVTEILRFWTDDHLAILADPLLSLAEVIRGIELLVGAMREEIRAKDAPVAVSAEAEAAIAAQCAVQSERATKARSTGKSIITMAGDDRVLHTIGEMLIKWGEMHDMDDIPF